MKLINLSGKIDVSLIDVIDSLYSIANPLQIPFFIIGARARDIILYGLYGITPQRATLDIDLAVKVSSWEEFNMLKDGMVRSGKFRTGKDVSKFMFGGTIVDILPFGPIAGDDDKISWPPEHKTFMNMLGFQEAYEYSMIAKLRETPDLDVRIPTLAGLVLMKLIAWKDKEADPMKRSKDAADIFFVLTHYEEAGNHGRLYESEVNLLIEEQFDVKRAGARLLGRDIASITSLKTMAAAKDILEGETTSAGRFHLVNDMVSGRLFGEEKFDEILALLQRMKLGLFEGHK
jgi:predicted nucleotidyltransferase